MQKKPLSLRDSVYSLCTRYPELKEILAELGFKDILLPGMLQSAGRIMTLPKGAKLRGVALEEIVRVLEERGFEVAE